MRTWQVLHLWKGRQLFSCMCGLWAGLLFKCDAGNFLCAVSGTSTSLFFLWLSHKTNRKGEAEMSPWNVLQRNSGHRTVLLLLVPSRHSIPNMGCHQLVCMQGLQCRNLQLQGRLVCVQYVLCWDIHHQTVFLNLLHSISLLAQFLFLILSHPISLLDFLDFITPNFSS